MSYMGCAVPSSLSIFRIFNATTVITKLRVGTDWPFQVHGERIGLCKRPMLEIIALEIKRANKGPDIGPGFVESASARQREKNVFQISQI